MVYRSRNQASKDTIVLGLTKRRSHRGQAEIPLQHDSLNPPQRRLPDHIKERITRSGGLTDSEGNNPISTSAALLAPMPATPPCFNVG